MNYAAQPSCGVAFKSAHTHTHIHTYTHTHTFTQSSPLFSSAVAKETHPIWKTRGWAASAQSTGLLTFLFLSSSFPPYLFLSLSSPPPLFLFSSPPLLFCLSFSPSFLFMWMHEVHHPSPTEGPGSEVPAFPLHYNISVHPHPIPLSPSLGSPAP